MNSLLLLTLILSVQGGEQSSHSELFEAWDERLRDSVDFIARGLESQLGSAPVGDAAALREEIDRVRSLLVVKSDSEPRQRLAVAAEIAQRDPRIESSLYFMRCALAILESQARSQMLGDAYRAWTLAYLRGVVERLNYLGRHSEAMVELDDLENLLKESEATDSVQASVTALLQGLRAETSVQRGLLDQAARHLDGEQQAIDGLAEAEANKAELRRAAILRRTQFLNAADDFQSLVTLVDRVLAAGEFETDPRGELVLRVRRAIAQYFLPPERADSDEELDSELADLLRRTELPDPERAQVLRLQLLLDFRRDDTVEIGRRLEALKEVVDGLGSSDSPSALADSVEIFEARRARHRGETDPLRLARKGLVARWRQRIDAWNATPVAPEGFGFLHFSEPRWLLAELIRTERALSGVPEGDLRSVEHFLATQALGSLARRMKCPTPSLEEVQETVLSKGAGLLFYLPALDGSLVLAWDRAGVTWAEIEGAYPIETARREFVREIQASPFGLDDEQRAKRRQDLLQLRSSLSELLLPPVIVARVEEWSRVFVLDPDVLGALPFENLNLGEERLLGLEKPVSYLPSLGVALELRRRSVPPRDAQAEDFVFVLGNDLDSRDTSLPLLDSARGSARRLLDYYGAGARLLEGGEAKWPRVQEALTGARVLQVVTHGARDFDRSRSSVFVLPRSEDGVSGWVGARELEVISAPELIFLGVCGAGRAPRRRGDSSAHHLGGALLIAGAHAVLLPNANLALHPTLSLSAIFHEAVTRGEPPADALLLARRSLASDPSTSDPYYHSLLHLVGLGDVPLYREGSPAGSSFGSRGLAALLVVALIGAVLLAVRRGRVGPRA